MNPKNTRDDRIKTPEYRQPCGWCGGASRRRFATKSLLAALLWTVVLIPAAVDCKTLNDAVTEQLEVSDNIACGVLLGDDESDVLGGNLQNFCGVTGGPNNVGSSAGGSAATATTLPAVVQERLKDAREEEEPETSGASADSVMEIGRYGVFISGEYENLDKDRTKFQDGYDSIVRRLTVGGDIQFSKRILAGLAFDTYGQGGRFNKNPGNFDVDSYRFVAYGSFLPIGDLYVQVSANYGITSNERKRFAEFEDPGNPVLGDDRVEGAPRSDFDADQYGAFITTGYNFRLGAVTLTPRAGYEWQRVAYEAYRESGGSGLELKFDDYDITSSLSTLGLQGSIAIGTRYGVLVPQASVDWKHQFDLDQQDLKVSFVDDTRSKKFEYQNEDPDRDYYEINAGLVFVMPNDFQVFGNYRTITSHSRFDSDAFTLGLRYDF
jgi:outer membrane autotransporter protein